ncbi:MAG: hypothetical protein JWM80_6491 [Cyanobacteria bacterium RYN_339]|nr:hypothetical protein [Cyanobacteria bacterium RYN_339]
MSSSLDTPLKKPLLYTILMREDALTREELDTALQEWGQRKRDGQVLPFGQVVISLGMLTDHEMQPFLDLQRKLAFKPGGAKPLGHLLIENAILRPSQVFAALMLQARTGQRLGELLIDEGVLRAPQLEVLLRFQARPIAS